MNKEYIAGLLLPIVGKDGIRIDEPMKAHTSFQVGGPADIMAIPANMDELGAVLEICRRQAVPVFVMGKGTNLIVRDKGIRGVVVKTCDKLTGYSLEGEFIEAEAGMLLSAIADLALEHGLSGFEFASGIPGTLGGAVYMNAGAYDGEMKDVVVSTQYLDAEYKIRTITGEEHQFGYRESIIQKQGGIVLKSRIRLHKGSQSEIKAKMDDLNFRRRDKQPLEMPSAGSIFRRPKGYFTGKLIEDCGLKGYTIGGAQVSNKHCGFIVNAGQATAKDILDLIQHVQETVNARYGVLLHTEVKIIGEE